MTTTQRKKKITMKKKNVQHPVSEESVVSAATKHVATNAGAPAAIGICVLIADIILPTLALHGDTAAGAKYRKLL